MVSNLYSLRDEVAQIFHPPYVDTNDDSAKRSFADALNSGKVPHPRDYSLWYVGCHDTTTGEIRSVTPSLLARADAVMGDNHE